METIAEIEPARLAETGRLVEKEMKKFLSRDDYLDNWYLNLPGSRLRDQMTPQRLDETGDETFGRYDVPSVQRYHSNLRGRKTLREFYADCDMALEQGGAPIEVVRDAVQSIQGLQQDFPGNPKISTRTNSLNNFTFDAFILLRAMGYNRFDLTA